MCIVWCEKKISHNPKQSHLSDNKWWTRATPKVIIILSHWNETHSLRLISFSNEEKNCLGHRMFRLMNHIHLTRVCIYAKMVAIVILAASWLPFDVSLKKKKKLEERRNCLPKSTSYARKSSFTSFYFWIPIANREWIRCLNVNNNTFYCMVDIRFSHSSRLPDEKRKETGNPKNRPCVSNVKMRTTKNYRLMHFHTL